MEDDYFIAHERPMRKIKKHAHHSKGLVTYAVTVAEDIPKGAQPLTMLKAPLARVCLIGS